MNDEFKKYKQHVLKRLKNLRPVFAQAVVGDFTKSFPLPTDPDDEFAELYTGIQIMVDTIKEKISNVESINRELKIAQTTAQIGNWEWNISNDTIVWSSELYKIFGINPKKVDPSFKDFIGSVHPDDQDMVHMTIDKAQKTKKPFSMYHRIIRKDGSVRSIHGIGRMIKNKKGAVVKMIGIAQDVTREQKIKDILEKNKIELEQANILLSHHAAIVQHSDDAIVSKDLNGMIKSWNKGAERIFGHKSHEVIGKHISVIIPQHLLSEEDYIINNIRKGNRIDHFETVRSHKNGKLLNVSVTVSPVKNSKGVIVGASKIARDITAQKMMEQKKEDFVGLVSHELKTPVTSIKMYTHILSKHLQNQQDTKGNEYIKKVDEQVDRLTKLVIDLLDTTRVNKGKIEYHKSRFYIHELVNDIVKDLKQATVGHKIIIKGDTKEKVFADKDRIRQVLINLITNGIKYSPDADKIIISYTQKDKRITVSVKDYGIGIAKDQQKKIFNRFYQVDTPELKTYPGLGLGLYICSEIVANNDGKLWVRSTKDKGSTFLFDLPIKK